METTEDNIKNLDFAEIIKELKENYNKLKKTDKVLRDQIEPLNTALSKIVNCTGIFPDRIEIQHSSYLPSNNTYLSFVKNKDDIFMLVTMINERSSTLKDENQIYIEKSLSKLPLFLQAYKEKLEKRNEEIKLDNERLEMHIEKVKNIIEHLYFKDKVDNNVAKKTEEQAKEIANLIGQKVKDFIDKNQVDRDELEIFRKEIIDRLAEF